MSERQNLKALAGEALDGKLLESGRRIRERAERGAGVLGRVPEGFANTAEIFLNPFEVGGGARSFRRAWLMGPDRNSLRMARTAENSRGASEKRSTLLIGNL